MLRKQSRRDRRRACSRSEQAAHAAAGAALQPRLAEAAAGSPVRQARACRCSARPPTGQPSTAEDVLEELADELRAAAAHPRVPRPRASSSPPTPTSCPSQVDPRTGRVHTSYHQAVAATGPAVLDRPEPAEHPDPHARGPAHPPGLHRAARPRADGGGLLADRAADHGAPVGRRRACSRPSPRTATSTRRPPPRSSASSPPRSRRTSGAPPRPSTSA
ncbi:MAG: hypothetical protein MZV65_42200 [Chromatiales bacterium]|nr:hypothetical protein [Chromatiales bacterium]